MNHDDDYLGISSARAAQHHLAPNNKIKTEKRKRKQNRTEQYILRLFLFFYETMKLRKAITHEQNLL